MHSVEATGKNIEQAIENALFELKAAREDCDIKILEEGGLFRKAKVLVSISPDEIEKYEKRDNLRKASLEETAQIVEEEKQVEEENIKDEDEEVEVLKSNKKQQKDVKDEEKVKNFIEGLLKRASLTGTVETQEKEDGVYANITGYSDIIGYRGEGLNALQYLTSVVISKNNRHAKRVRIDCDNYRQRRESSLIALAQRMAKKVERTNASVKLEPMTANERRIIHTALADSETVETLSKGEEPHRFLIIKPKG